MPEIFFFTNRGLTGPPSKPASYSAQPAAGLTTGIARVSAADLPALRNRSSAASVWYW